MPDHKSDINDTHDKHDKDAKDPKDAKDKEPRPFDSPEVAVEKSGSMDTRVPEGVRGQEATDVMAAGTKSPTLRESGTYLPTAEPLGEGEAALELERRGVRGRGDIQRG